MVVLFSKIDIQMDHYSNDSELCLLCIGDFDNDSEGYWCALVSKCNAIGLV
jgi:hypothetical protein